MKVTYHNPPITKEIEVTYHRKWWKIWQKPKSWTVVEKHDYYLVIDLEGEPLPKAVQY